MKKITLLILLFPFFLMAQKTAIVKGVVKNNKNKPIEGVSIRFLKTGTYTDAKGKYQLRIPVKKEIILTFSHVSYQVRKKKITANSVKVIRFSPILNLKSEKLDEIIVEDKKNAVKGMIKLDANKVKKIPGANAGVENLLMTYAGVNNNNELSTQYNVRGGNFDENLVYVNGIEVYRPFLIRSGQQEGLSFINPNMVQNIHFSAGGFQAKYGDRLSSVLDITYRKPKEFNTAIELSSLGAAITIESISKDKKISSITGVRYRDNSLMVNSKQIQTNFRPLFADIQSFISYKVHKKLTLNFLGNFSLNDYNYKPISRITRFGTVANPTQLFVNYEGQEQDKFVTLFGAFSSEYQVNENLNFTGTVSSYNTQEEEYFDIKATYSLGEVNTDLGSDNFGEVAFSEGIGSQINHARNDLDALITNIQLKGSYKKEENQWNFGVKYQTEDIKDRIIEWEMIDSLGFSVRPVNHQISNNQPYEPFEGPLVPFQNIRAKNKVKINRLSGFVQFSKKSFWNEHQIWYNIGVRAQSWSVTSLNTTTKQLIVSPRVQFAIKPNWKKDVLFRMSGGLYAQAPFYKELKDFSGVIHPEVKAQKSIHFVIGNDYSFSMWNRPFKLTSEIYYKSLSDINPYAVDNVRIRYQANNNATGYATGFDIRLNGEFVPGNESWVSLGVLKTQENINQRGFIARPTDQRFKLGILFQDYVPNLPDLKAYLNLVYNTGVPGGSPVYSDVYQFQRRLGAYRRADLGISYVFVDTKKQYSSGWLHYFKELTVGLELFNMFDIRNAITNTWVRDVYSKRQYAIPNYMTGRVLNFKIGMQF